MGSFENLDRVKAYAMRRYNMIMKRDLTHSVLVTLVLLMLLSISFHHYPVILETTSKTHLFFLHNYFFAFLFLNFIVFLVLYLSNSSHSTRNYSTDIRDVRHYCFGDFDYHHEFYVEYVAFSNARFRRKTISGDQEGKGIEEKRMQFSVVPRPEGAAVVAWPPMLEAEEGGTMVASSPEVVLPAAVESHDWKSFCNNNNNNKCYRRTRSELMRRKTEVKMMINNSGRKLRLSESTEFRRVGSKGGSRRVSLELGRKSTLEEMDNEEFRMTVDQFIAAKKKLFRNENLGLLSQEVKTQESNHFYVYGYCK